MSERYGTQNGAAKMPQGKRKAGLLKGKVWMADDFNEPLEDMKDYV